MADVTTEQLADEMYAMIKEGQGMKKYFPLIEATIERSRNAGGQGIRKRKDREAALEYMKKTPMPTDLKSIRPYIDAYDKEHEAKAKK